MSLSSAKDSFIDSLRLSDWERDALISQMDKQSSGAYGVELRNEERIPYQVSAGIVLKLHHPGGSVANYLVRPRNISAMGLGFLHGNFLYVGSEAHVHLHTRQDGQSVSAAGKIMRCQHVRGHVHEVGMKFDQPIDLRLFAENCVRASEGTDESTELPTLAGRVLYVEDLIDDQELLRYHLTNLGVEMTVASNGLEAMELVQDNPYDMIITGVWLPGMSGPEIAAALRQSGYGDPIIAMTSDGSEETRQRAIAGGCTDLVHKPYTFDVLIDVLSQHLPSAEQRRRDNEVLLSTEWPNSKMRPLILSFISRLERSVRCLDSLLQTDSNGAVVQKMCMDLKGSAGGYGYPQVSRAAAELHELAGHGAATDALRQKFAELEQLTRAACLVRRETARG